MSKYKTLDEYIFGDVEVLYRIKSVITCIPSGQTGETTAIRRIAIRETCVFRHKAINQAVSY